MRKDKKLKSKLEKVRERFDDWRATRLKLGKIPEELWEAAIGLYPEYSICKIAETLRLNHGKLKKRILNNSKKESKKLNAQKESNKSRAKKERENVRIGEIREELKDYRKSKKKRSRIPERLWEAAIDLYPEHSIYQIAKTLRLDYASVKKRILQRQKKKAPPVTPAFIQVDIPGPPKLPEADKNEWLIEMENADGAKMKISVKSSQMLNITAMCQNFMRS